MPEKFGLDNYLLSPDVDVCMDRDFYLLGQGMLLGHFSLLLSRLPCAL